ncbi:hypothetical protein BGP82_29365 [Pseudomonas putida]|uniref:Uncharacterized protein n=1 Tax=Pseudomonas putida TaxID=303 RepID=A0A2S3X896_PSEPU|nr:hypothetical protein BGP82_29365 [Pseudomonas putida]
MLHLRTHLRLGLFDLSFVAGRSPAEPDADLAAGYSSRGVVKVLTGAGGALASGTQAYLDATEAKSISEFFQKSAYTQPTNALAFGVGVLVGGLTGPAIVVIALSLGAGLAVQFVMSDDFSGMGTTLGNFLKGKD